jgi:hypothetical protein|tara:strand:- start:143 stop:364 length:222 start_codon:yes stop_codon:yes gene_type:complete
MAKEQYPIGHIKYGTMGPKTKKEYNEVNFSTQDINKIEQIKMNRTRKSNSKKSASHLNKMSKLVKPGTKKYYQ